MNPCCSIASNLLSSKSRWFPVLDNASIKLSSTHGYSLNRPACNDDTSGIWFPRRRCMIVSAPSKSARISPWYFCRKLAFWYFSRSTILCTSSNLVWSRNISIWKTTIKARSFSDTFGSSAIFFAALSKKSLASFGLCDSERTNEYIRSSRNLLGYVSQTTTKNLWLIDLF